VAEFSGILEFIGLTLAAEAVVWTSKKIITQVTIGLEKWWTRKASRGPWYPEVGVLRISYDDIDIAFYAHRSNEEPDTCFLSGNTIAKIPLAIQCILEHFTPAIIEAKDIKYIGVPLIDFSPTEPEYDSIKNGQPAQHWEIGQRIPIATHIYDTDTHEFQEIEYEPPTNLSAEYELG